MIPHATLREALEQTPLFEDKSWRLSPRPWPVTAAQLSELERIGQASLEFHQALEVLYLRSSAGRNLLRNRPLLAPWVADYLDRGKPERLRQHARSDRLKGRMPMVIRPDLLCTQGGFSLTELDSVPGGIGLTAFLGRLYGGKAAGILGGDDDMLQEFYRSLAALAPERHAPVIAIVVSDEAATYRPEMEWLAARLQEQGRRVYCVHPNDLFPLGTSVCLDQDGSPEHVDVIYRFFELFDLPQVSCAPFLFEAWEAGGVEIAPPMRPFQEEKLGLALLHHPRLEDYWKEAIPPGSLELLKRIVPRSWVVDPAPLPPGAVLDAPLIGGRAIHDWRQLAGASQRERDLILKISGFHETAWGARSVTLGSDVSKEEWSAAVNEALGHGPSNLHILQEYRKPVRLRHPVYATPDEVREEEGRVRLCPYYFVRDGKAVLTGCLATFCPSDKKIIHGMQDAALLPTALVGENA
jgi:hypothetical protein